MVCVECVWSVTRLFCVNTYQSTPPPLFTLYYQSMNQRVVVSWAFLSSHTHSIQSKHTNAVCMQQNRRVVAMVRAGAKKSSQTSKLPKLLHFDQRSPINFQAQPAAVRLLHLLHIATAAPPQRNSLVVLLIPSFLSKLKNVLVVVGVAQAQSNHRTSSSSTHNHTHERSPCRKG